MGTSTIVAAAAAALAEPQSAEPLVEVPGEYRVYSENDFFNPFTEQTDRYYTQGLRLERLTHSSKAHSHFLPGIDHKAWCRPFCGLGSESGRKNTGFAIGQNMYTPARITIAAPQPDDRPWAGLLYISRIARVTYKEPSLHAQRQDRIEALLGIVGPASLAEPTQIAWHKLIGSPHPEGWNHQLKTEPVVQLRYDSAIRWPEEDGKSADVIARVRGHLGNALTALEAEVTGRVGWELSGFGVQTIPGAVPLAADRSRAEARSRWLGSGNVFVRAGMRAVAHNIFLDGNSFASNDIRIDRKPFVPEIAVGVELNLVGNFWVSYQFIRRGSEFDSSSGDDAPAQEFGAITLAWAIDR